MTTESYIGYRPPDYQLPFASYFAATAVPQPSTAIVAAVQQGAHAPGSLPPLATVSALLNPGYVPIECGYTLEADGSARLAILTPMPGVQPLMWHWWFGWHGDQDAKYKLWHPQAHVSAVWKDGGTGTVEYIGRTSHIQEYIGKTLEKAAIQFIEPTALGLPDASNEQLFICARVGFSDFPLDYGWLVHQVRAVAGGAEMRSRFWIGGEQIAFKSNNLLGEMVSGLVQKVKRVNAQQAADLLTHCSEEMHHLATFLPALYAEFQ